MKSYAQRIIGRYDKNQDGLLTEDEYSQMLMSPHDADRNKDGKIELDEYARWMSERAKK
ncbi:EF-hand domain-containing protein [Novipirellula artificiosorum]|uniref:EF hand n=1 Tax=Novipirellula artificiosorum TaxID=2528016 RepID=A0A5C6D5U0_9BACT|nr:EF hand [Novipirellula artificiosorum]